MPDTLTQPELAITGKAREDDDDELLLLLLLLYPLDASEGAALWGELAPAPYSRMLGNPPWPYDPGEMQWSRPTRGHIERQPSTAIKSALIAFAVAAEAQARTLANLMTTGRITLPDWQTQMYGFIKRVQVAAASVARGGTTRLPASELARTVEAVPATPDQVKSTGDMVIYQAGRLRTFAKAIQTGEVDTAAAIEHRATLYARQAVTAYEEARKREAVAIGVQEALNVMDATAEHCLPKAGDPTPDCPGLTAKGYMPIDKMPPVYSRRCKINCKCRLSFRRNGTNLP